MNNPKKIFVHCTATPEGRDLTADDVRRMHKARGWQDIGYHSVVRLDGDIELGRDLDNDGVAWEHIGAHASGHNRDSLAVVYVGGVDHQLNPKDTRTPKQHLALLEQVTKWMSYFDIHLGHVYGHYEVDPGKACPSFDMGVFRKDLYDFITEQAPNLVSPAMMPTLHRLGPSESFEKVQRLVGAKVDGYIGPNTWARIAECFRGA